MRWAAVDLRPRPALLAVVLSVVLTVPAGAQDTGLGRIDFPTSGSGEAQAQFLTGVAALHSFWYPVALEAFRKATEIDPGFAMGYWGEAMAHNHPLWGDPQETEAARAVLEKIEVGPELSERERGYVEAVHLLYGTGDKHERDEAYAAAMQRLSARYPDDLEAAAFYALALLGMVQPGGDGALRTRMRAAAVALEVLRKAPEHPGATHYVLHAFDDPDHAILALPAAHRYAELAPAAPHALHMPSHIFLQLGMWPEVAASNEASWAASDRWVREQGLPPTERDHHSLHWLVYAYLQQGRYNKAGDLLVLTGASLDERDGESTAPPSFYPLLNHALMAAAYVVETQQWDVAERFLASALNPPLGAGKKKRGPEAALLPLARAPAVFAHGLAAAMAGKVETARKRAQELKAIRERLAGRPLPFEVHLESVLDVQILELTAAVHAASGRTEEAMAAMRDATALEEKLPPPTGPPLVLKPSHELYGELLLRAEQPEEAERQFAKALYRHPDRARSLIGNARALAQQGNRDGAARLYARLTQQWQQAEADLPALREAYDYMRQAAER